MKVSGIYFANEENRNFYAINFCDWKNWKFCGIYFCDLLPFAYFCGTKFCDLGANSQKLVPQKLIPQDLIPQWLMPLRYAFGGNLVQ